MDREAWSANREFATARGLGMYSPRGQEVLRLAGMSLASLSNIPSQISSLDVSQAVSYISQYLDSSSAGDSSQSGVPTSGPHDFSEYLQQMKAWELVMGEPDPFSSDTPQSSNTSPLRLVSRSRKRESEPGAPDVRSVPSIFFQDSFDVEDSATFHAACPIGDLNEAERIHNLEGHLDKVEAALEAEVSARAAELVDVSLDISRVGRAVQEVHKHTTAIREQVTKSADDKLWELETLQTLKLRKARWTSMQQTISRAIEIRQTLASADSVMDVSDWLTAADTISLAEVLHSKAQAANSLACLANVPNRLSELRETLQKNLMTALQGAAEFKGMEELTISCCRELEGASSLEDFSFTGELTSHFTDGGDGGMGLPPQPGPDGTLPAIWELQQAALWPPLMAAQRTGALKSCLSAFADAAVAATRSAVGAHLHACVHALLRSERKSAKDSTGVPPSLNAPLEELLQWLRPIAFAALLQSLQLLLRVLHWFYSGCGVFMDACLGTVNATAAEREMCQACNAETLQRVMDAFQQRWAWLLTAAFASELEQYSSGGQAEAAPVTLNQFLAVTEMSKEVEALCTSAGSSASAVLHALKTLGKHLLKGHASGLQGQLELVLNAEPWTVCTVDPAVQHFVDDLLNPTPSSSNLSRRSSLKWEASNNGKLPTPSASGAGSSNGASNGTSSAGQSLASSAAPSARTTAEQVPGPPGGVSPAGLSPRVTASSIGQESVTSVASKASDVTIPEEGVTAASLMSALDSAASKNAAAERLQASLRSVGEGDSVVLATGKSATRSEPITSSESLKEPPTVGREEPDGEAGGAANRAQGGQRTGLPSLDVESATSIVIGEERYVIVSSVALLLQHLDALLAFGHVSLSLRYEMGSRIAELIRVFNVRSSELLLGAGAIVSAGLRSITARHMAVCSQCLLLLEVLLPRLRYVALGGLPAVQVAALASLFEAITEGVAQHRQQIHSKLVNIMRERLSTSLKFLNATATSWAAYNAETTPFYGTATPRNPAPADSKSKPGELAPQDSIQPTKPKTVAKMMLQIARQVTTLHEALAPVMSRSQQAEIGMRVRRMYSEAVARALRSLQPSGEPWLQAAEHDVMVVIQALKLLPGKTDMHGLESIGEYLQQVQDLLADTKKASEAVTSSAAAEATSTAVDGAVDTDEQPTNRTDGPMATLDSNKQGMMKKDEALGTDESETVNSTALDQNAGPEPETEQQAADKSASALTDGQQQDASVQGDIQPRE